LAARPQHAAELAGKLLAGLLSGRAIEAAFHFDEVKELRDKAVALELYAKQAGNHEAEDRAREIRLRAERRGAELIRELRQTGEMAKNGGDR
jgi:hypothetical protein